MITNSIKTGTWPKIDPEKIKRVNTIRKEKSEMNSTHTVKPFHTVNVPNEPNPPHTYTIEEIKELLPSVKVRVPGGVILGRLSGRLEQFAKVHIDLFGIRASVVFSWESVKNSLNEDRPLIIG